MAKKRTHIYLVPNAATSTAAESFLHRALVHATGALGLLISISFFTATYDTAQVKLTLLHMGGLLLTALWAALQIVRRKSPFTKHNFPFLLPLFAYLGWNIVCYVFAPYHLNAAEEFFRFILYTIITLLAATEFSLSDIKAITNWFLIAVWICFAYGAVQILDRFLPGVDVLPWRGFFTKRIFSTLANPNFFADFIVFCSCITAGAFLATRKKPLLLLLALGATALFFTESKGAWMAYAAVAAITTWVYANFGEPALRKYRLKINLLALLVVLGTALLVGVYTSKRFQSVSFRAHTWLGTFEMIKDAPIMGVGTGNFKTIYSAYRRPQIFYIENSHNTETQHAENELLEQWAVSGTVGLAIFLWLTVFLFTLTIRTLSKEDNTTEKKFYLLGYGAGFLAIWIHSLVDISVRFASTGFFFALFMGCIIALCMPTPAPEAPESPRTSPSWILAGLRFLLAAGLLALGVQLFYWFYEITSVIDVQRVDETSLLVLAWIVFAGSITGSAYLLLRAAWLLRNAAALCVLLVLLPLELLVYRPFQANHYYSLGITFSQNGNLDGALIYFTKAIRFSPFETEYHQFRANLLATALDLTKRFSPARGDTTSASDDYSRALQDFAFVEKHSPNPPLLYHNKGQLYYTMALRRNEEARRASGSAEYEFFSQEALRNMELAKKSLERSLLADPVNPETYFYLIQIALLENQVDTAQRWIDRFRQGPDGVTEPKFLNRYQQYPQLQALQAQVNARRNNSYVQKSRFFGRI